MDRRRFFKISSLAALATAVPSVVSAAGTKKGDTKVPRCRVTVLRRECYQDLQSCFLDEPEAGPCPLFKTGEVFTIDAGNVNEMVENGRFCPKAWECIKCHVNKALTGNAPCDSTSNRPGQTIACCSDGTRPVVFKIESI